MKKLLLVFFLLSRCAFAAEAPCRITDIVDGDTLRLEETLHGLPLSIRLLGVDTPEKGKKAKCASEAKRGQEATDFVKEKVSGAKVMTCDFIKHDKFGGRILAEVKIDGVSLNRELINTGLAREYHGEKKGSWCNDKSD